MARQKIHKRHIRKISKVAGGSSYAITIPIGMMRKLRWQEHQQVTVQIDGRRKRLVIEDWSQ